MVLVDVSRAHFYADTERDVFVRLPDEDPRAGEAGLCGKLLKTMYGIESLGGMSIDLWPE